MTRHSPLHGKRVLLTRPEHQSRAFAQRLKDVGAYPIFAPMVEIVPPLDDRAARTAVRALASYDWLIITSANGADALFRILEACKLDVSDFTIKIAAIGAITGRALAMRGITATLVPDEYVAEALADKLVAVLPERSRILLLRAAQAREILPQRLRAAGHTVNDVAVYRTTIVHDAKLAQKVRECDILTFTSASTVKGFVENGALREGAGKIVACIGPVTAQAARAAGLDVTVVAREHTMDGLLAAMQDTLQSTGSVSAR